MYFCITAAAIIVIIKHLLFATREMFVINQFYSSYICENQL